MDIDIEPTRHCKGVFFPKKLLKYANEIVLQYFYFIKLCITVISGAINEGPVMTGGEQVAT